MSDMVDCTASIHAYAKYPSLAADLVSEPMLAYWARTDWADSWKINAEIPILNHWPP